DLLQIVDEAMHLFPAGLLVGGAKYRGGMNGRHYELCKRRLNQLTSLPGYAEVFSEQSLSCHSSKTDDKLRLDHCDLGLEPWLASCDLRLIWLFVNAAFSAGFPFEMLDDICNVGLATVDPSLLQRFVE